MPCPAGRNDYVLAYAGFEAEDPALVSVMNVFSRTPEGIHHFWASELLSRPMANGHPRHVDIIWPPWNLLDMIPEGRRRRGPQAGLRAPLLLRARAGRARRLSRRELAFR